jgi:hypothetical protein
MSDGTWRSPRAGEGSEDRESGGPRSVALNHGSAQYSAAPPLTVIDKLAVAGIGFAIAVVAECTLAT